MSAEAKLKDLGIELPQAPKPMGVYKPIIVVGNMAYLSGHGPLRADGKLITGRLGLDMDVGARPQRQNIPQQVNAVYSFNIYLS